MTTTETAFPVDDRSFDALYPEHLRALSKTFWTPLEVATAAARELVDRPGCRVLDVGCGPGKFCLAGAASTAGHFTGIEQRAELIRIARATATQLRLENVTFRHANMLEVDFSHYDAFYLFNPFTEHSFGGPVIDRTIPLEPGLRSRYTRHLAAQLGGRPLGTRVATYGGYANEVPACYDCVQAGFGDELKIWCKTREFDPGLEQLALTGARSYRGAGGWGEPRRRD